MTAVAAHANGRARVLIAADHDATRQGMRLALSGAVETSEVDDAEAAVAMAVRDRPDVCVVDFSPSRRGIHAAAEIVSKLPGATVVVMTDHIDEDEFLDAVRAGATGYVSQRIDPSRLPAVIQSVMRGEAAVPRSLVARLIEELRGRERRRQLTVDGRRIELTAREWQVLEALRSGLPTREIAGRLGISEVTVRRHISGVHRKVGVNRREDLLRVLSASESTQD